MNLFLKGDKVQLRFKLAEIFSVAVRMTPKPLETVSGGLNGYTVPCKIMNFG